MIKAVGCNSWTKTRNEVVENSAEHTQQQKNINTSTTSLKLTTPKQLQGSITYPNKKSNYGLYKRSLDNHKEYHKSTPFCVSIQGVM